MKPWPAPMTQRAMCGRCRRPVTVCYCAALVTLETRTRIVLLQHPRERDMPIGTARIAKLCLPAAELHVGAEWDGDAALRAALSDPARPPILLYPGPGARDVLADPPRGPVTLVVVDGTWSQTKTVVRDNAVLAALPRYAFAPSAPSEYRIRKEPRFECVSTIEALVHVLGALEGDPERFRALLGPFRAMVDAHLAEQARHARSPRVHLRREQPTFGERLPEAIRARFCDLVCVVGEANAWPVSEDRHRHGHELVHWVARRVATGETFDAVAAPRNPVWRTTPMRVELDEARLHAGAPRSEVIAAFQRFLRPSDVIASWGPYGPRLFEESGGALPASRLDVRAVARNLSGRKIGTFESYAAAWPDVDVAPLPDGRAGRRLGMLARILRGWRGEMGANSA